MVEETAPRRRQAFSDENLYLEPVLAPLLRRVEVPSSCRLREGVSVTLERAQLWKAFFSRTNEMIVTRKGRKMFPTIRLRVSGLEKTCLYAMCLEFVQVHDIKFRYIHGDWKQTSTARADPPPTAVYVHPKSYQMGAYWMSEAICFDDVKITNDKTAGPSMMPLNSMHMYEPRLHIVRVNVIPGQGLEAVNVMSHRLRVTGFVAVTAYQNDKVTALKVENNPFARAFNRSASALAAFELSMAQTGQMLNGEQQQHHHQQQQQQQQQHQLQQQQQQLNTEQGAHMAQNRFQPYPSRLPQPPPQGSPLRKGGRGRGSTVGAAPTENGDRLFCPEPFSAVHQPVSGDLTCPAPFPPCSVAPFPECSPQLGSAGVPLGSPAYLRPELQDQQLRHAAAGYQCQWPPAALSAASGYRTTVGTPSPASSVSTGGPAAGWADGGAGGGGGGNYWCGDSPPTEWGATGPGGRCAVKLEPACLLTPPHGSPAACAGPPARLTHPHPSPVSGAQLWPTGPVPASSCGQSWTPAPPDGLTGWPPMDPGAAGPLDNPLTECAMGTTVGYFTPPGHHLSMDGAPPASRCLGHGETRQ
ncbi:T-box transcription factor T homolog [Amphibalanus amphitrite]|uniref:T-box transcription factor T homolog n=1 Tax=Amphibalanus amphitrite TaxID=1232801 RepID=UPI001C91B205|nr:T-box transcription factor T homolog [Amphibalanus amphitrite]